MRGKAWMLTAVALTGLGLAQIRADGSSTVYPITQAVAEEFTARNPNIRVVVAFSGTGLQGRNRQPKRQPTHPAGGARGLPGEWHPVH